MTKDFFMHPIHVAVYFTGRCPYCHAYAEMQIYDYGRLPYRELERRMDQTDHQAHPIPCPACGRPFLPTHLEYREVDMKETFARVQIPYGQFDWGRFEREKAGHEKRFEVFQEHEEEFWRGFENYAIEHWREAILELSLDELHDGFRAIDVDTPKTLRQCRQDAIQLRSEEEKRRFWRAANRTYIHGYVLDIGPMGWKPEAEAKEYGRHRTRYVILHFPLDEGLEQKRTELIGRIVRTEKGDGAYLYQRISQLTDELDRTRRKLTDAFHRLQEARAENARLQRDLSEAYDEIRRAREDRQVSLRDPDDVRKIRELKGLVSELIADMRELEMRLPADGEQPTDREEPEVGEKHEEERREERVDSSVLAGKTIGILGGMRRERAQSEEWPCEILAHPADRAEPEYYRVMEQADILVVITTYISHAAMWEARAHALAEGIPIIFTRHVNTEKILEDVARVVGNS